MNRRGALVISLDFEIHWGVRDHRPANSPYRTNLLGERQAIPAMLRLFEAYGIHATWATVGMLFARTRDEWQALSPRVKPHYTRSELFPYDEPLGEDEEADPLHFAPTLIGLIRDTPGQEIATHTFSHYYCLEHGQSAETFAADLESARSAMTRFGLAAPESIVFPRNQRNAKYDDVLQKSGIKVFRGNQRSWMHANGDSPGLSNLHRAFRLVDTYAGGKHLIDWDDVEQANGLFNVPASFFFRPYSDRLKPLEKIRIRRLRRALRSAAEERKIIHLWWHPHNFGSHLEENLGALEEILSEFSALSRSCGMQTLTMNEVARQFTAPHP
jgi:peptidoglycan/xylan/chitin deacetylase (PgdA/CDA1 family)